MFNSKAVSSIRFIALCMIVSCHIFQAKSMVLAWWFNVGVQIFLFISGFLYGTKYIDNSKSWIKKRFVRITAPYYLFLLAVTVFYLIFDRDLLNIKELLGHILLVQGFVDSLPGVEHLWFIPYILICYFFTPILQELDISNTKNSMGSYVTKLLLLLAALQILKYVNVINLIIPDLGAYIIGYYFSRRHFYYEKYQGLSKSASMRRSAEWIFAACILTTPLTIYLEYFYNGVLFSFLAPYTSDVFAWNHTILGITLFLAMYFLFDFLYSRKTIKVFDRIIKWSDKYSYTVYLTHQIVILGKYTLLNVTPSIFINIALIVLYSVISGMALQKLNCLVLNKFNNYQGKRIIQNT